MFVPMPLRFTAIVEPGEKFLIASCAEIPEAVGQGTTRQECLRDLADSIRSVLEYRQSEAIAKMSPTAERTEIEVVHEAA
jgi:predicted RNase H-like HicB family nuclease